MNNGIYIPLFIMIILAEIINFHHSEQVVIFNFILMEKYSNNSMKNLIKIILDIILVDYIFFHMNKNYNIVKLVEYQKVQLL
jgi:hypothetical protein